MATLQLNQVTMRFGRETLFRDVNLSVENQESLVLIGPSGLGKSVLLKLFAGILTPTSGAVLVEGQDLALISDSDRTELLRKMGMLFQKNALFDSLSVGDNIAFPLRETTSLPEHQIQSRVDEFLEAVGLSAAKVLHPNEISGGMQKRLGIARALTLQPRIVLYDDPTAGLDPITSRKIIDLIMKLKKQNQSTIVTVTNDMTRAFQIADRIAMIIDQTVLITGNREQTLKHPDPRVQQFVHGRLEGPLTAGA